MNSVSLYVHIPFCLQKCDYCDFFSLPCKGVKDQYVQALVNEGKFYAKAYGIYSWKTLYAGGGTPSLLTPEQMAFLLEGLSSACPGKIQGEATFELNPETVSPEKLLTLKEPSKPSRPPSSKPPSSRGSKSAVSAWASQVSTSKAFNTVAC